MAFNFLPDLLDRPLRQFPSLWSNFIDENLLPSESASNRGARIYEENNQLHVEVPLPGLNSKDIDISLNNGILSVKGETSEEDKDKKRKYYRSSKRSYSYSFMLPKQIDEKMEPQASYEDGILNISLQLPKPGSAKKIAIKGSNKNK